MWCKGGGEFGERGGRGPDVTDTMVRIKRGRNENRDSGGRRRKLKKKRNQGTKSKKTKRTKNLSDGQVKENTKPSGVGV